MQTQGINITSSNAPGSVVVGGGMVAIKSLPQLLSEERAAAEQANNAPVVQNLVTHIRQAWSVARMAKENSVEPRMLQSLRQRRGEYDPDKLQQLQTQGSSLIYMSLSSTKCRAASSWLRDVLLTTSADKPWSIDPTPVPDIDPSVKQQVLQNVYQMVSQMHAQGMDPSITDVRQMIVNGKDEAMARIKDIAKRAADRMEEKMQDQLLQGGWLESFSEFIDDITTFPSAFLKGPVVRRRPKLKWVEGPNGTYDVDVQDELVLEWERVDPFSMYPAPDSSGINDGYLIERHRLHRADLNALMGVEGYSDQAIRAVLDAYGKGGLHDWINIDQAKADAEGKNTYSSMSNPSELIDALQFWGSVQGKLLLEWGYPKEQVPDPLKDYNVEAWLIGNWIIKASINPDPLGRKPYYKASYEEIPGAFWGNAVTDLCRDSQDMCNAAARALVNNMGIASGPQVVYNVDRLPAGEDVTQLYPWKVWQVTNDPLGGSQPMMQFFQPNSLANELMAVYDKFAVLADEYTGIPRYMTGDAGVGGAGRTASGMSMLMGNAGKSIKQVISNIDIHVTQPAIGRLYYYNMRYSDDPDLKGDICIVARGANSLIIKEQAQQRRNEYMQLVLNSPIAYQVLGMEGVAMLLREGAKGLGMNTDVLVPPIEILKQRWAMQQAAQAAQLQQQAQAPGQSGGSPPGLPGPGAQLQDGAPVTNTFANTPQQ
jgi:hypothetical protein